jgi:hypothetical protein
MYKGNTRKAATPYELIALHRNVIPNEYDINLQSFRFCLFGSKTEVEFVSGVILDDHENPKRHFVSGVYFSLDIHSFTPLATSMLSDPLRLEKPMEMRICHLKRRHQAFHLRGNLRGLARVQIRHQIATRLSVGFVDDKGLISN